MGHGHRKSHSRASRGATPEVLSKHLKDRHDLDEGGSKAGGRKRREKRNHKRKRGHEDVSKRRHKERHRGSHHSSKSSKQRGKGQRWKDGLGSQSDSSSGSLSSKEAKHGRSSHCHNDHVLRKRSRSPFPDVHKEQQSKRMRVNTEDLSSDNSRENNDALIKPLEEVRQRIGSESGKARQQMKSVSGSKSTWPERERDEMTITNSQEQGMGSEGRKDRVLEVELRQKALENFMRHRTDGGCCVDTRRPGIHNERNEQFMVVDKRYSLAAGDAVSVDVCKDTDWQLPWNSDTIACPDEKCPPAKDIDDNLEEGEIGSDTSVENETGNENASSTLEKGKVLHEKGNLEESSHANRVMDHDSRIVSEGERERVRAPVTAPSISEMREPHKEQAVKESPNGDPTSAHLDSNNSFQEKTMSVMRGGELVQVSYKVYIPKRAADLAARRRLQR